MEKRIILIEDNLVDDNDSGVILSGGFDGATRNIVIGEIMHNSVATGINVGIGASGGWSASNNQVDAMIASNAVDNSHFGISVFADTTQQRENNSDSALDNAVTGTIAGNTECNTT